MANVKTVCVRSRETPSADPGLLPRVPECTPDGPENRTVPRTGGRVHPRIEGRTQYRRRNPRDGRGGGVAGRVIGVEFGGWNPGWDTLVMVAAGYW